MKVDKLLSRLRSITGYMADPISKEGSIYAGKFILKGRTVEGWYGERTAQLRALRLR